MGVNVNRLPVYSTKDGRLGLGVDMAAVPYKGEEPHGKVLKGKSCYKLSVIILNNYMACFLER